METIFIRQVNHLRSIMNVKYQFNWMILKNWPSVSAVFCLTATVCVSSLYAAADVRAGCCCGSQICLSTRWGCGGTLAGCRRIVPGFSREYFQMRSRISIRGCVGRPVRRSHTSWISEKWAEFEQNKIMQNKTMPFKGQFRDKYASRSPERIWCLNSVRLVSKRLSSIVSFEGGFRSVSWWRIFGWHRHRRHRSRHAALRSKKRVRLRGWSKTLS